METESYCADGRGRREGGRERKGFGASARWRNVVFPRPGATPATSGRRRPLPDRPELDGLRDWCTIEAFSHSAHLARLRSVDDGRLVPPTTVSD